MQTKEALNKSRLAARHIVCLHLFRHNVQISLAIDQYSLRIFVSSDEKFDFVIAPSELRGGALNLMVNSVQPENASLPTLVTLPMRFMH